HPQVVRWHLSLVETEDADDIEHPAMATVRMRPDRGVDGDVIAHFPAVLSCEVLTDERASARAEHRGTLICRKHQLRIDLEQFRHVDGVSAELVHRVLVIAAEVAVRDYGRHTGNARDLISKRNRHP